RAARPRPLHPRRRPRGGRRLPGVGRRARTPDRRDLRSPDVGAPDGASCDHMLKIGVRLPRQFEDSGEYLADARAMDAAGVDSLWLDDIGDEPWLLLGGNGAGR